VRVLLILGGERREEEVALKIFLVVEGGGLQGIFLGEKKKSRS